MADDTFDETAAIGMAVPEARDFFKANGYTVRVTRQDGENHIGTRDFRTDRVNVHVESGRVVAISGVG